MNSSIPIVFEARALRRNRDRAGRADPSHRFLVDWCMRQLADRMDVVRRRFPMALQIGALADPAAAESLHNAAGVERFVAIDMAHAPLRAGTGVQADPDMLPFADHSFDLVFSPFALHTVNDLPGALAQIRRVLKPDGLFIAAMAGGETLRELRDCLGEAEAATRKGLSPRVFPFADKPQAGALLQRAGFALPVIDSDIVTVTYANLFRLLRDLRLMGEGNSIADRDRRYAGKAFFMKTAELYQQRHTDMDGRIAASFEIVFLLGWSPHASQQQPLRPGQATIRLADALGTDERSAGERVLP
jgi:NADH dehydrogenase [ubiquinone] 1 alpha subcomplex assembly factor 5